MDDLTLLSILVTFLLHICMAVKHSDVTHKLCTKYYMKCTKAK